MDVKNELPEFRYNPSSGDWVIIATSRFKRPHFRIKRERRTIQPKKDCPFCPEKIKEQLSPLACLSRKKENSFNFSWSEKRKGKICPDWKIIALPNKFPALMNRTTKDKIKVKKKGVYQIVPGVGFHEVIVYRHHFKQLNQFSQKDLEEAISFWQQRFLVLEREKNIRYISFFTNFGQEAGASLEHPHSQIIAAPIFDPDFGRSLKSSFEHQKKFGECVHCQMIKSSLKEKKRILLENKDFVALIPFAPTMDFETRIYPKKHQNRFQDISPQEIISFASALKKILEMIKKKLKNPSFNFFIRTSPVVTGSDDYSYYHWHLIILPRVSVWGGFEFSAGMQIISIFPEQAASFLRNKK